MNTPIRNFVAAYQQKKTSRLHMPGHKGMGPLGCEEMDITEIQGADALYEAAGVIAESERNASALFDTRATFYSTEGSTQCIKAMLFLALQQHGGRGRPFCLAGRNAHKAFLHAAALLDFDVNWLYPEEESDLCACPITAEGLKRALENCDEQPFCVYVTSPDYLGGVLDIGALSAVCHENNVPLLVDNAHGAYLKFLPGRQHPMELGADLCCDSAHKTLPVLTGGAYLHIGKSALQSYEKEAKRAMALFGSTSPSYLILQSLDMANAALAGDWPQRLLACCQRLDRFKERLMEKGFSLLPGERTKLVIETDGPALCRRLAEKNIAWEFADDSHVVLMFSPENSEADYSRLEQALESPLPPPLAAPHPILPLPRAMTIREAVFSPAESIPVEEALGRICAAPTVSCPPAVPIVISGEIITLPALETCRHWGVAEISVVASPDP